MTRAARVLLDTSVVIGFPAERVADLADTAAVSAITMAELSFGLHSGDPLVNASREQRYHWVLRTFEAIPFDAAAARTYGALCAAVRDTGRDARPRRLDLLISAVAVSLGVPLVTRNARDFRGLHASLSVLSVS